MKATLWIKFLMAVLLAGCIANMPYGYYQLMRWVCCGGFIYLAFNEHEIENKLSLMTVLCAVGAMLFNPIAPIHFQRLTWNVIDIVIAALLLGWAAYDFIKQRHAA